MFVDYEVPNAKKLFLRQSSDLTCWAGCAAGVKSAQAKKLVIESSFLPEPYLTAFKDERELSIAQIVDLYSGKLRFKNRNFDVSSPDAVASFVQANAPIIVASSIVTFKNGAALHQGYHVRLVYGVWGDTGTANEDDLQVKVFDPSQIPPTGFQTFQPFLFTHFLRQMELKTGRNATIVGQCWYA
jgi:hypothetical protein